MFRSSAIAFSKYLGQYAHRASSSSARPITTATSRRRMATIAALFTATSATALASYPSRNNEDTSVDSSWNLKQSTVVSQNTVQCEEDKATEKEDSSNFPESLLKYDHYNGVIIHLDWIFNETISEEADTMTTTTEEQRRLKQLYQDWNDNPEHFEALLQKSLKQWTEEGRKGIWIHVPRNIAGIVPACIKLGFDFHSCQSKNQINAGAKSGTTNLILSRWLPTETVSRLPLGPYFQAGVGCVVLHPDNPNQMLVVQEITGPAAARKLWKMPTGLIDPGEDISEAALRELEEETGLQGATCRGILAFRQAHGASAGRASSDLFFVCLLSVPSSSNSLDNLKPQEHEIADIKWMPVEEYAGQELWQKSPVYQDLNQAILDAAKNQQEGKAIPMVIPNQLQVGFFSGTNTVYRSHL